MQLREVLTESRDAVKVQSDAEYRNFGIYSFGRGLFRKPNISGLSSSASSLFRVRAGQIIYSRLFAFEGAYGLCTDEFDGHFVSNEYPTFDVDRDRLLPEYAAWFLRSPRTWEEIARRTTGMGDRRQRIQVPAFLAQEIPLPPLAEQRRVARRLEVMSVEVGQARRLLERTTRELDHLVKRGGAAILDRLTAQSQLKKLRDVVTVRGGGTPSKLMPEYWRGSVPWVSPKDMKTRDIMRAQQTISERATQETAAKLIEPGSVLIVVRGMILAHTVPSAVLRAPAAINQDMKALMPLPEVDAEYLRCVLWARNGDLLDLVDRSTHDTRKLETDKLLLFEFPVPPIAVQKRVARDIAKLQEALVSADSAHAIARAFAEALLPATLAQAFNFA